MIAREAECRAGELLAGMKLKGGDRGGGRPSKTKGEKAPMVSPLAALGIKPAESKRMQAAASVPAEVRREVPSTLQTNMFPGACAPG